MDGKRHAYNEINEEGRVEHNSHDSEHDARQRRDVDTHPQEIKIIVVLCGRFGPPSGEPELCDAHDQAQSCSHIVIFSTSRNSRQAKDAPSMNFRYA